MNEEIRPFFDQLIEDRTYTESTGPAPTFVVEAYINQLETLLQICMGDFTVQVAEHYVAIKMK